MAVPWYPFRKAAGMSDFIDITQLLVQSRNGDPLAENDLFQLVYAQLRRRAHALLHGDGQSSALSSGTLVHEAFTKLFRGGSSVEWQDRAHFYSVAANAMKQVIIEHARRNVAVKRGDGKVPVQFDELSIAGQDAGSLKIEDVIAVSDACDRLAVIKPLWAQVVELRFFGGLTVVEIVNVLGVSHTTVENRLTAAKAFLRRELTAVAGAEHAAG